VFYDFKVTLLQLGMAAIENAIHNHNDNHDKHSYNHSRLKLI